MASALKLWDSWNKTQGNTYKTRIKSGNFFQSSDMHSPKNSPVSGMCLLIKCVIAIVPCVLLHLGNNMFDHLSYIALLQLRKVFWACGLASFLRMTFLVCSAMALAEQMRDPASEQRCSAGSDTAGWEDVQRSEWEDPENTDSWTCKQEFSRYYFRSVYFPPSEQKVPLIRRMVSSVSRNEGANEMKPCTHVKQK